MCVELKILKSSIGGGGGGVKGAEPPLRGSRGLAPLGWYDFLIDEVVSCIDCSSHNSNPFSHVHHAC